MMPTERLRDELAKAKTTAAEMKSPSATAHLRRYIDRIERCLAR